MDPGTGFGRAELRSDAACGGEQADHDQDRCGHDR
jgi:hypothetical protein